MSVVTLKAVGDLMLGGNVGQKIKHQGADYLFDPIRSTLSDADITIGNLECPLTDRGNPDTSKKFAFRGPIGSAASLKKANFSVVVLANNHVMDYGPIGLYDTMNELKKAGISPVGAGSNFEEACRPLILDVRGMKIGILAFSYATRARRNQPGCCPFDPEFMAGLIRRTRSNVDSLVVSIHYGLEYVDYPNRSAISLFRRAVESGANLVLGHHPHVVQGIESYKNGLIVYSLGNFVSGFSDQELRGLYYSNTALALYTNDPPSVSDMRPIQSFILHCELDGNGVSSHTVIPVKSDDRFQVWPMDETEGAVFLEKMKRLSERLSFPDDTIFDQMEMLMERCNRDYLGKIKLSSLASRITRFRPRHLRMMIPFIKAKLGRI